MKVCVFGLWHLGCTTAACLADPSLIDSTFTKLFYLDGEYMKHFEKFLGVTDISGTKVIVWKIRW